MTSTSSSTSHLASILGPLAIPSEYGYYDKIIEQSILVRLDEWKKTVEANLAELRDWINQRDSEFSVKDQAAIVSVAAAFYGEAPWILSESRELVEGAPLGIYIHLCAHHQSHRDPKTVLGSSSYLVRKHPPRLH